mmetsp:Transcript_25301/g.58757  ORF Transcript_25301/g.58757 Transcript_25301/m.58757 type:complete len:467 (+) Transcript_25301:71-1471(+)
MGSGASSEVNGVRVFKVHPGSPAAEAGLEVFFDFVVEVNGVEMDPEQPQLFAEKIKESENSVATLKVYNARCQTVREVAVRPRAQWGPPPPPGQAPQSKGLLGATVRFDSVDPGDPRETPGGGVRVLDVFPNSPAAHAGLVPFQDFLLGTAQAAFRDVDELVEAVQAVVSTQQQSGDQRRGLEVYVYNSDTETVREVLLVPNNDWGGEGCIGCDIGTGLLHRIPQPRNPPGGVVVQRAAPTPGGAPPAAPPGGWNMPGGLQPNYTPSYPPGYTPAAPGGAAPPAAPPSGIPPVPTAPGGPTVAAGTPAIRPSGMWTPAAPAAPPAADASSASAAPAAPAAPPSAAPAAAAQPAPAAPQNATALPGAGPGGIDVSLFAGGGDVSQAQQQVQLEHLQRAYMQTSAAADADAGGPASPASMKMPRAPPSTPMSQNGAGEAPSQFTLPADTVQKLEAVHEQQSGEGPSLY